MPELHYEPPRLRYRFLLSDGTTVDVIATQDDSDMRRWALDTVNKGRKKDDWVTILGTAPLGPDAG